MIRYDKGWWGLKTFGKMYGSAFPKALPFSLSASIFAGLLSYFYAKELDESFIHPYPFQTFAFVVGFMVVFRSNLSYGRYWEGRTNLQLMTSKLTDAVVLALTFDREAVPKINPTVEQVKEHQWFRDTLIHLCSLLHAVALATLRTDYNMENIVAHDSLAHAPRANIRGALRDLNMYPEEHQDLGSRINGIQTGMHSAHNTRSRKSRKSSGAKRRSTDNGPGGGGTTGKLELLPEDPELQMPDVQKDSHQASETAGLRSFWDYFLLPTGTAHAAAIYRIMKLPVVGGMTQAEGVALGAFVTSGDKCLAVPDLNLGIHGVLLDNGMYAPAPTERVHTLLSWLQQIIIERIHAGGIKASPPIQARIHSTLTDCMLGYEQCKKLVDTPFPFPWAQAVNIVLLMFSIGAPVVIVAHTSSVIAAVLITFAAVHTHIMLNEVARDIEDPYHYDPNELPLPQMQYKLNERLIAVSHSRRPVAFTDVGELTGPGNTILLKESPGPMQQLVAPPTSALAPPRRPTVPPAGFQSLRGIGEGSPNARGPPDFNQRANGSAAPATYTQPTSYDNSPFKDLLSCVSSGMVAAHTQSQTVYSNSPAKGVGSGRRGIGGSVSFPHSPAAGPCEVSAHGMGNSHMLSSGIVTAAGGGPTMSSALTTGSRPGLTTGAANVSSSEELPTTNTMSLTPPSQSGHLDPHPFAPSGYPHDEVAPSESTGPLEVGDANGNCPTYRSTAPPQTKYRGGTAAPQVPPGQQTTLPPHPSQPTFAYGLLPTEGSTNSSLLAPNGGDGGGHLTSHNSGDIFGALDTTSTRCDRPRPSSQLELRQYSSTNELPPAAQNHNMRWRSRTSKGAAGGAAAGCGSPPSAGGAARSARGLAAGAGSSPRWGLHRHSTEGASPPRVVSGDLEGTESVWSSECPDQGNRMLHISGRPDDKASGWPYNTRRW